MKNIKKIIISLVSVFVFLFSFLVVPYHDGNIAKADSVSSVSEFEERAVLDDLENAYIDGEKFSLWKYPFSPLRKAKVLSFVEYGYSFNATQQGDFGLYVYLYNPQGKQFLQNRYLNKITLKVGDTDTYKKYPIEILSFSQESDYYGLFYKLKVILTQDEKYSILMDLNSAERIYTISEIEMVEPSETNAATISVGREYRYKGYMEGLGPSNGTTENTLKCLSEVVETLSLDAHATVYRPKGTNGKNAYTHDSLHSVYFAVPNDIIEKYGEMTAVHATWLNAVLKPGLVTGNLEAYRAIESVLGVDTSNLKGLTDNGVNTLKYGYIGDYNKSLRSGEVVFHTGDIAYLPSDFWQADIERYNTRLSSLYMLYYSDSDDTDSADDYTVSRTRLLRDLREGATKYGGDLINGKYAACMFESVDEKWTDIEIERDYEYKLTSQKISQSFWQKIFGKHTTYSSTFDGINTIQAVTDKDITGNAKADCDLLFINNSDYADFYDFYESKKSKNTVYLFRYQMIDYVSEEATLFKVQRRWSVDHFNKVDTNAYIFQETVNLDFDIIDVTFTGENEQTVIPVVMSPIDVAGDVEPPANTTSDKESWWKKLISTILGLITFVLIAFLCISLFPQIVNLIAWLLQLVVKGIGAVFRAIGNLFRKNNKK